MAAAREAQVRKLQEVVKLESEEVSSLHEFMVQVRSAHWEQTMLRRMTRGCCTPLPAWPLSVVAGLLYLVERWVPMTP